MTWRTMIPRLGAINEASGLRATPGEQSRAMIAGSHTLIDPVSQPWRRRRRPCSPPHQELTNTRGFGFRQKPPQRNHSTGPFLPAKLAPFFTAIDTNGKHAATADRAGLFKDFEKFPEALAVEPSGFAPKQEQAVA